MHRTAHDPYIRDDGRWKMIYTPELFAEKILSVSSAFGFSEAEVLFSESEDTELMVLKKEISHYESSILSGLSFRGIYNGNMGYAHTEIYDDEAIDFLLVQARDNALVNESNEKESIYEGEKSYREVRCYSDELDSLTFSDLAPVALALEEKLISFDPRVEGVDHCAISYGKHIKRIENTRGLCLSQKNNLLYLYADIRCRQGEQIKTASAYWFGRDIRTLNVDTFAKSIANKALSKLGARAIKSNTYKVLLGAEAAADILHTFSDIFSAESIQKGFSLLDGKMGEKVAADFVILRDDAYTKESVISTAFDSEGVSTKNRALIENGILTGILHNRKTAKKDNTKSTGNGFRSYKGSLGIASKNFYIVPGTFTHTALLEKMGEGIFITEVSGLHAGADTVSGDFSLLCEGYQIKNGRETHPLEQITIAGNILSLLKNIIGIGDSTHFLPPSGSGSTGSPELLIDELSVSGL